LPKAQGLSPKAKERPAVGEGRFGTLPGWFGEHFPLEPEAVGARDFSLAPKPCELGIELSEPIPAAHTARLDPTIHLVGAQTFRMVSEVPKDPAFEGLSLPKFGHVVTE
jgi:hypothetical protein